MRHTTGEILSAAEIGAAGDSAKSAGGFGPALRVELGCRSTAPGASILLTCSDLIAAHDRRNLSAAEIGAAGDSAKWAGRFGPVLRVEPFANADEGFQSFGCTPAG